jgi:CDP-diacylglycerol--glycerol-3-phosphate 3-phosphatidyltransferase
MKVLQYKNLPNILTFIRLIGGSLFLPFLIFYLLPYQVVWVSYLLAFLFVLFSMTDFLDGYLARRYGLESAIGRALDPIADKFLVCSSLIALLAINKIYFLWVIILIGREMCIMSLRHIAALHNISVSVSYLGKIKACMQMFLIIVLIARPVSSFELPLGGWAILENTLLLATLYFALISFYKYANEFTKEYLKIT